MYSNKETAPASSDRPSYTGPKQDQGKSAKLRISNVHYEVSERELEVSSVPHHAVGRFADPSPPACSQQLLFAQIGPIASGPKISVRDISICRSSRAGR